MPFRLAASAAFLLLIPAMAWTMPGGITVSGIDETVLVFRASSLKTGDLPPRVVTREGSHVFTSQLSLACLGKASQPADLLLYFTESRKCERMPGPTSALQKANRQALGLSELSSVLAPVEQALQDQTVVTVQPRVQAPVVAGLCICRGEEAPVVTVTSGSPQSVLVGNPILSIRFSATDSDTPDLAHEFSFRLDGGSFQPGLPGTLTPSCVAGPGTLECSIDGTAPLQDGNYELRIVVDDGLNFSPATAALEVLIDLPNDLPIFFDGFEGD